MRANRNTFIILYMVAGGGLISRCSSSISRDSAKSASSLCSRCSDCPNLRFSSTPPPTKKREQVKNLFSVVAGGELTSRCLSSISRDSAKSASSLCSRCSDCPNLRFSSTTRDKKNKGQTLVYPSSLVAGGGLEPPTFGL